MLVCNFYNQLFLLRLSIFPLGQSYLYTSLCEKYPGPLSKETKSNTKLISLRKLSVVLPGGENVSILLRRGNRPKLNLNKSLIWWKLQTSTGS